MGALTGPPLLDCEDVVWLRQDPALPTSARRTAAALAGRMGMAPARVSEVELAVTEAATNLNRHAADGALLFRILRTPEVAALELLVVDSGPGMADVAGSLVDGVSTAGTLGIGLGVLARMADVFDVHSLPGRGTVLAARFWGRPPADGGKPPPDDPAVAGVTRPISGEEVCGDVWAARLDEADPDVRYGSDTRPGSDASGPAILLMLCDGLGHGPLAAKAGAQAKAAFQRSQARQPQEILSELHTALVGTRGGAVAVARVEPASNTVRYCGVGNISGFVITPDARSALLSAPGIVGHQMPRLRVFEQPLPEGSALIMHSDGLTERWSPKTLPGLLRHGPAVIAGQLLREAGVRRDDASVLVAKGRWVNPPSAGLRVLAATISSEQDVFALRRHGRLVAQVLGLEGQDQVRMATALSELGRDRLRCVGAAAEFTLVAGTPTALVVAVRWKQGPAPSREALESASRLLQHVEYDADDPARGITVVQALAAHRDQLPRLAARVGEALSAHAETSREDDLRAQTRDLIESLAQTRAQRDELHRLNEELETTNAGVMALYTELSKELEETNSGVVALHGELEDKSRQLREASEAKTRFWANVSHELRAPVNSVIGLTRLLLSEPPAALDDEQRQQVSLIASSGSTLLALVDELLDVAKAESGQLVPQPAPVDLRALLAQLYGMMRATASQSGTALVISQRQPPARIVTDEVMLTRVLRNLLSNSLKFTEGGEVRLEVRTQADQGPDQGPDRESERESAQPPRWLEFEVSDTGVGIPPDEQERIFEEFYQVRGPHQRGRTGTGLGLPYARRLTELLGGTLALSSVPGHGTTVTVRLPAGEPREAAPADAAGVRRLATLVSVDDDPEFSALIRPVLEGLAEHVVQLDGTNPVLDTVRRERPDAIVVDLHMPSVDGYELVGLLGADAETHGIPVIVVTSAPSRLVDRSRLAHARAVVDKRDLTQGVLAAAIATPRGDGSESTQP